MKVLVDTGLSGKLYHELLAAGHDTVWTGMWAQDPGDVAILQYAYKEGRVLITLDNDFGELAVAHGHPHAGIIRLLDILTPQERLNWCLRILIQHGPELLAGAIFTVYPNRVRKRPPNIL